MVWAVRVIADDLDNDDEDYDALPGRTEEQIDALIFNFDEVVETIAIYASLMSVLVIILLLALALRLKTWAAYIGLTILSMIWFALFEQLFSGLYWLGFDIGYSALVVAGFALASLHVLLAGLSIDRQKTFGWTRPFFFILALGVWGVLALHWPVSRGALPPMFTAVAIVVTFGHLMAVPSFFAAESPTVKVARNGLVFAVIVVLMLLAFVLFGEVAEDVDFVFLGRLILLSVVAFFSVFLVRHAIVLLWDRDTRVRAALEAARRDAEQSRALFETEQKYSRARDAAQRHTLRLATASHDIRQPIVSLRSTMAAVAKDQPKDVKNQLNAALDYLDQLAESYIDSEEAEDEAGAGQMTAADKTEIVETQMICATLDRMFRKEAEAKSLSFKVDAVDVTLAVAPLAVMRILSNLISNAIKHTPDGEVILQGEPVTDGYKFTVFNTANLPENLKGQEMFESFKRGESSTGTGLGLSIVDTLSNEFGMTLSWTSEGGQGTTFCLTIPSTRKRLK